MDMPDIEANHCAPLFQNAGTAVVRYSNSPLSNQRDTESWGLGERIWKAGEVFV